MTIYTSGHLAIVIRNTVFLFILCLLYAVLRYIILGPYHWTDLPVYVANKAVAFTLMIVILKGSVSLLKHRQELFKLYMQMVSLLAIIHILMSISLLSLDYYPKLSSNSGLNIKGSLTLLTGILTAAYMFNKLVRVRNAIIALMIMAHLFVTGYSGWIKPDLWHGFMPPFTLICFVVLIFIIIFHIRAINKRKIEAA